MSHSRGQIDPESAEPSDEDLIARAAAGDRVAFEVIVARYAPKKLSVAWRMTNSRSDAEDLLQEAFLRLWRSASDFKADRGARFGTWFHRILVNLCIDFGRRRPMVSLDKADDVADPTADASERLIEDAESRRIATALAALPDRQRAAIVLCYYEGLSNAEAAEVIGVTVHGLEALLVRGRRRLRQLLAEEPS